MLKLPGLPLSDLNVSSLELEIEPIKGFEIGFIHLKNVTVFRTPSGIILIYGNEN
ncbi:hypothetical protein [Shimazuella kribbensis]|uniref:hypothetical protein n=1 Tax=Shimazuella kribbensis TaxID=139808 RepID=UPI0003FD9630|nr:hypothetical protein [Shimazuella kribbensis]